MAGERGESRAIYTVIADDPDFQELSPAAKAIWYTLRMKLGASGIAVIGRAALLEKVKMNPEDAGEPLRELIDGDWLIVEKSVLWLRNALRFEPYMRLDNDFHRVSIEKHLRSLPKLAIVNQYADYYGLPIPFPDVEYSTLARTIPPVTPHVETGGVEGVSRGSGGGVEAGGRRKEKGERRKEVGSRSKEVGVRNKEVNQTTDDRAMNRSGEPGQKIARTLMPIVRGVNGLPGLYGPSGGPGRGRTEAQDVNTLATMHERGASLDDLEGMILGTIMMREAGDCDFAEPGEGITTGALYNAKKGVMPFSAVALDYFHKHAGDPRWQSLTRWRTP